MGTTIVFVMLAAVVAAAVRSMIKDKKAGRSLQCGQNCSQCHGCCRGQRKQGWLQEWSGYGGDDTLSFCNLPLAI